MKHKWLTFGALAASGAVLMGMLLRQKKKKATLRLFTEHREPAAEADPMETIAEGIAKNAHVFEGLYEALFQAERNRQLLIRDAYEEWCTRAQQLEDRTFAEAFAQVFSCADLDEEDLCREKFRLLLECIQQAGILRERENGTVDTADEKMCLAYRAVDGHVVEAGMPYTVLTSAWIKGDKVIEYGMVMKQPAR